MRLIKSLFTIFLIIALLLVGILFTLRNQAQVPLDLLFIQLPDNSLALWMVLSLITGALLGLLLLLPWLTRCKAHSLKVERQLKQHQKELHQLRTLSLKSSD